MKRMMAISLCVLFLAGCGGAKSGTRLDELERSNADLSRRVKTLEDNLLQDEKKLIQQEQTLQAMHERIRDMENAVNKIQIGPAPAR